MVISLTVFSLIPDFPEYSTFLTEEEKKFVKARLQQDVGKSAIGEKVTLKDVLHTLGDYRLVLGAMTCIGSAVPVYGIPHLSFFPLELLDPILTYSFHRLRLLRPHNCQRLRL